MQSVNSLQRLDLKILAFKIDPFQESLIAVNTHKVV